MTAGAVNLACGTIHDAADPNTKNRPQATPTAGAWRAVTEKEAEEK